MTHRLPLPSLRHLASLTDDHGVVEHAHFATPRPELGYCTDDAGRALSLACRLPDDPDAARIAEAALGFLERAHRGGAVLALRWLPDGTWSAEPSDDAVGRALLGLGTAASRARSDAVRTRARALFAAGARFRSPHPRATAYAALGGAAMLSLLPRDPAARRLLAAACDLPGLTDDPAWAWPAPRLTYANAVIPAAQLAAGAHLGDRVLLRRGLTMLSWLVDRELHHDHFSFTPTDGRGPGEGMPRFDQQPIEASTMADACARAYAATGDQHWLALVDRAAQWFCGRNDRSLVLYDEATGGGYDGLQHLGPNLNEGAESSIAFVGTMTLARRLAHAERRAS